jgi:hypothetical protein
MLDALIAEQNALFGLASPAEARLRTNAQA